MGIILLWSGTKVPTNNSEYVTSLFLTGGVLITNYHTLHIHNVSFIVVDIGGG